jgi:hypothetical protein
MAGAEKMAISFKRYQRPSPVACSLKQISQPTQSSTEICNRGTANNPLVVSPYRWGLAYLLEVMRCRRAWRAERSSAPRPVTKEHAP